MNFTQTKIYKWHLDVDAEKDRLKLCFKGRQLRRQLDILRAIQKHDIKTALELYDNLPDCPENGWTEREYVGAWIWPLIGAGMNPDTMELTTSCVSVSD